MRLGKRQPKINRHRALGSYPVRNQAVEWRAEGEQRTVLIARRREDAVGRLLSLFFVVPKERKYELDAVGSYVWQRCDGRHTVEQLIRDLAARYKLNRKEAEVSLAEFLRRLGKRKLVALAVPREPQAARDGRELSNVRADGG